MIFNVKFMQMLGKTMLVFLHGLVFLSSICGMFYAASAGQSEYVLAFGFGSLIVGRGIFK